MRGSQDNRVSPLRTNTEVGVLSEQDLSEEWNNPGVEIRQGVCTIDKHRSHSV